MILFFVICVLLPYSCSHNSTSPSVSNFSRGAIYHDYLEFNGVKYSFYPARVSRTNDLILVDVDWHYTTSSELDKHISMIASLARINNDNPFYSQHNAADKFSHSTWSVEMSRHHKMGHMYKTYDFDKSGNVIYQQDYNDETPLIGSYNTPFIQALWDMCHTKVTLNINNIPTEMYLDEFWMLKDSLQVNEKDILSRKTVPF